MRRHHRAALPTIVLGSAFHILIWIDASEAALVRSIHARQSDESTEIVIGCDGDVVWHGAADAGGAYIIEIEAELAPGVARRLPVVDERIGGVTASAVSGGRVRIHLDVNDNVHVRVQQHEHPARLVARLQDGGAHEPARPRGRHEAEAQSSRAPAASRWRTQPDAHPKPRPAKQRGLPAPESREDGDAGMPVAPGDAPHRRPLIVIDPGHGGKDPGAKVWAGELEKDIVLAIATTVAERLRARLKVDVVMTRTGDRFVSLQERRDLVERWNADLFVSIHANASGNEAASGVETYYPSGRSSGPGRKAARVQGAAAHAGAPRRAAGSARRDSVRLARNIQSELVRHLGMRYKAVRDLGIKEGPFYVLQGNDVPSVLVEAAFLTHREEGLRIRSESYRDKAAEGIVGGIARYLGAGPAL